MLEFLDDSAIRNANDHTFLHPHLFAGGWNRESLRLPGVFGLPGIASGDSTPLTDHLGVGNRDVRVGAAYAAQMRFQRLDSLDIWERRTVQDAVGAVDVVKGIQVAFGHAASPAERIFAFISSSGVLTLLEVRPGIHLIRHPGIATMDSHDQTARARLQ